MTRWGVAAGVVAVALFLSSGAQAQVASASVQANVAQPQPVAAGANFDYVINISSEGPDDAANMSLTFPLPAGVSFQSEAVPAGWSCNAIAPGTVAPTVTCTTPSFPPGTVSITITASTPPDASGTFSTTATISSTTTDPNDNDNSATVDVIVSTQSDFGIALAGSPNPVTAGTNLTWTMTVTNNGPSTGVNATATLPLPAPTTFVSIATPAGWSCITPPAGTNGTISCSLTASMNPAASATFTIVSNVPSSTSSGSTLSATATVSSPDDLLPINDSAEASVPTSASADLAVTKVLAPSLVVPGSALQYTITVTNNGPSDTASTAMSDVLPAPLRFTSLSWPAGWACTTPAAGSNGTITCSIASLPAASSAPFTLNVTVAPGTAPGTAINNSASAASAVPDPNSGNNSATASAIVATPASITASKSVNGATHAEGSSVTYPIVLTNSGSIGQGDNPGNELTDVLPASLTLVSAAATGGTAVANIGTNTVTWNGAIAGGGSVTVTIQAVVKYGTIGTTVSNQASVSFDSDANGTNDAARQSDDPNTAAPSDPTSFLVAGSVPALSRTMILLLGAMLAAMALFVMKT